MSFDATNWAIKQRGLRPAAKIVLWHLCDRYHPDHGCFPSQETLAEDCELPRSTLNVHLNDLEAAGLIMREQRREKGSKRQDSTRYRFPFEKGFEPKKTEVPCPESGHGEAEPVSRNQGEPSPENGKSRVQNLDSNPVREPVKETSKEREGARESETDRSSQPGTAEFLKRVQRFLSGDGYRQGEWPNWAKSTTIGYIAKHFAGLSEPDRREAEAGRDAFLLKSGKGVMGAGNYFRDRAWEVLTPRDRQASKANAPSERPDNWAPAYGPVHSAVLLRILLSGPDHPEQAPQGGLWLSSHVRSAWPRLASFQQQTDLRSGVVAQAQDVERSGMMQFVPLGTDVLDRWKAEMQRRSLPSLRIPEGIRGLYLPAMHDGETPADALARFEQAIDLNFRKQGGDHAA